MIRNSYLAATSVPVRDMILLSSFSPPELDSKELLMPWQLLILAVRLPSLLLLDCSRRSYQLLIDALCVVYCSLAFLFRWLLVVFANPSMTCESSWFALFSESDSCSYCSIFLVTERSLLLMESSWVIFLHESAKDIEGVIRFINAFGFFWNCLGSSGCFAAWL